MKIIEKIKMKKIVVITPTNPRDSYGHSGVVYSICNQVAKENEIIWLKPKISVWGIFCNAFSLLFVCLLKSLGYTVSHHPAMSKVYAAYLNKKLSVMEYDCILCFESMYFAYIKTEKPILYRTDGVFHSMVNYYITNVPDFMVKCGDKVECSALMKATYVLYPSKWVYDETLKHYPGVSAEKLQVIESGANIPWVEKQNEKKHLNEKCLQLLFIGSDPKRKGVDVAIDCVKCLNETFHREAILTIVGGAFEYSPLPYVNYIGRINKNNVDENKKFTELLCMTDFLLFPTRAECAGIVSCEAAAYGIPVLAYRTGGVPSYVIDGINGHLFEPTLRGLDFANYICSLQVEEYAKMSSNARFLYETKFNWDVWGDKVNKLIREL